MAFDGNFCCALSSELKPLIGGRIEKIFHSGSACVEMIIYVQREYKVLVLSALPSMPYAVVTGEPGEHPNTPTMFCLLLRKHLSSAKIVDIYSLPHERVICFECDSADELGYTSRKKIYAELMGKYSNIILCDGDRIAGALHTADITASKRQIMGGLNYMPPPPQDKLAAEAVTKQEFLALAAENSGEKVCDFILRRFLGFSPLVCREIAFSSKNDVDALVADCDPEKLWFEFRKVTDSVVSGSVTPTAVYKNGKPFEFSFIPVRQYGTACMTKTFPSLSELLIAYYDSKKTAFLISDRANELLKVIDGKLSHTKKKQALRKQDLDECSKKEKYRLYGELLTANLYKLRQGMKEAECENYENGEKVLIPLDIRLTPAKNAQKYYKLYAKYRNAEVTLSELVEEDGKEILYLESVFDSLARAATEQEINEIKSELEQGGYIRAAGKKQRQKPLPPFTFRTSDGMEVRVGRNNIQNDELTKSAEKNDIWFHVKGAPGSHTILVTNGKEPSDSDYTEAAKLAAEHSSVRNNDVIEVDYTRVRNVKKPSGAKPGYVIYEKYFTCVVKTCLN